MGQKNSKDEMVYQQVIEGNVEAIKALSREGARLEWVHKGKTPLIYACMDSKLYIVAKTLIELGANVNAYCPGSDGGTPLHHAAMRGLCDIVKLLLRHEANPFVRNDDCKMPLDVARAKGYINVVRAIEDNICYYSGDVRESMAMPGFLESLVPQRFTRKSSKKCWIVVVPSGPPNKRKPPKLELAVYSSRQDPQPRTVIPLWKSNIVEPKFHESDPSLTVINESTKTRHKFISTIEGDRQQLVQLYSACKGYPKVMPSVEPSSIGTSPSLPAVSASNQLEFSSVSNSQSSSSTNGWGDLDGIAIHNEGGPSSVPPPTKTSCNGWANEPTTEEFNGWADASQDPGPSPSRPTISSTVAPAPVPSTPSAPPLPMDGLDEGPVHYPAVDMGPMDPSVASSEAKDKADETFCVICWEAPIEGACIPCGHMAGCMTCLTEIKSVKGVCPVCRATIDQIVRLYAV